ncbi:hypothetical protein JRG49_01630 [Pseudomonas fulva]|uniref:hypothetical protein n=1 Tax=Pseudomonas TaxID=286 RepID=UPI0003C5763D|nr:MULTISPECIES: hypothetical protein [Pseudomonas]MCY4126250.1 hypothetical protein [Pseudomonas sp.]AVF57467.1 hypothetical protein AL527_21050 [Pseudomonas fulva]EST17694.1 hypothetical protein EDP1_278 [Pseudomonas putida S610]MBH3365316.1 hypothetical protein [Pseudomonas sp. URMO17WK12:I11]MBN6788944.1 hypothetical protein [Pseudomonas fulva]
MTFTEPCADLRGRLTHTANNSALYASLVAAQGWRDISEQVGYSADPGYRLIRVDDRLSAVGSNEFEIALVDDVRSAVAYYDKVTLVSIPEAGNRLAARNQIWRSADVNHILPLREITQKVLFGYIAQLYNLILAEGDMPSGGRFYWHRQVSRAIEAGFYVYVYESTTGGFRSISTQHALNDLLDQIWSADKPEPFLALVSTFALISQ